MKKNLLTAVLMTIATTILFGLVYPLVVTGLAQVLFPKQANGQLIQKDGKTVGSRIIGQGFSGPAYFHSRPSAAGNGYDAANSGGSNLGPTNQKLIDRVKNDVSSAQTDNPGKSVPIDLVTTSASGFDPHITPAAADFQVRSQVDIWVPIALDSQKLKRSSHTLRVIARLKPGVKLAQAQAELDVMAANLAQQQRRKGKRKGQFV